MTKPRVAWGEARVGRSARRGSVVVGCGFAAALGCGDVAPAPGSAAPSGAGPGAGADSAPPFAVRWYIPVAPRQPGGIPDPRVGADARQAYASVAEDVTAYDLATGAVRWHATGLAGTPRILPSDGSTVVFAATTVAALDAATGVVRWQVTPPAFAGEGAPVQDGAHVYVGTASRGGGVISAAVRAYDHATGRPAWTASVGTGWPDPAGVRGLTLADGTLYATATQCTIAQCGTTVSWVIALDPATGAERWRLRVGAPDGYTLLVRPVVAAGGLLLAGDYGGNAALAIDPVRRRVVWRTAFAPGSSGPTDAPVDDSSGMVYIGSGDTYVYALDRATGARRWASRIGGSVNAFGRCGRGLVAQALGIYAVRPVDGRILATAYDRGDERATSEVVSVGDRLVVGTAGGVAVLQCP